MRWRAPLAALVGGGMARHSRRPFSIVLVILVITTPFSLSTSADVVPRANAPDAVGFYPTSIDDQGRVAGICGLPYRACLWDDGKLIDLGYEVNPSLPGPLLNRLGQVVGTEYRRFEAPAYRVMLWDRGALTPLGDLGGDTFHDASDINDHGEIVGRSETSAGDIQAVVWDRERIVPLGVPYGYPEAINNRGQVMVTRPTSFDFWEDGASREIELFWAFALNNHGQVAGGRLSPTGEQVFAAIWKDGVTTDIGQLDPSELWAEAEGINDKGQVVGTSFAAGPCEFAAAARVFFWERGRMTDLGVPESYPNLSLKINGRGQVIAMSAGYAADCSGITPWRAFFWEKGVLTEIEPGSPYDISALDLNERGEVVGIRGDGSSFIWKHGATTEIGPPGTSALIPLRQSQRAQELKAALTRFLSNPRRTDPLRVEHAGR